MKMCVKFPWLFVIIFSYVRRLAYFLPHLPAIWRSQCVPVIFLRISTLSTLDMLLSHKIDAYNILKCACAGLRNM